MKELLIQPAYKPAVDSTSSYEYVELVLNYRWNEFKSLWNWAWCLTFYSFLIRRDGGTFDAHVVLLDGMSTVHRHWKTDKYSESIRYHKPNHGRLIEDSSDKLITFGLKFGSLQCIIAITIDISNNRQNVIFHKQYTLMLFMYTSLWFNTSSWFQGLIYGRYCFSENWMLYNHCLNEITCIILKIYQISKENMRFSRNSDIKTTTPEECFYFGKVYF